jgi:hypothetical protein
MKGKTMFKKRIRSAVLFIAVVATGLFALTACEDSGDVASPTVDESTIQAAGLGLPSVQMMSASVNASADQEASLGKTRSRWENTSEDAEISPMLGFLEEASEFLDHGQMVALVNLMAETCEESGQRREQRGERRGHGPGHRGPGSQGGILEHADELGLSEEQVAQLQALQEELRTQMHALMGDRVRGQRPTDEQRAQMDALREAHIAKVQEVLTDEQWEALQELRNERREARQEEREARHEERSARHLEFLATVLGLSEEQKTQLAAIQEEQFAKMQALRDEFRSGLEGERPSQEALEAHRKAMDTLREEGHAAILEVLDEEQAELFEALAKLRANGHGRRGPRGGR